MLHILGFFIWRIYGTEINSIPFYSSTLQHLPFWHLAIRLSISNHLLSFHHADSEKFIHIQGYNTNWQRVNHPKLHCHWLGEDKNWFLQWPKQLKPPIKSSQFLSTLKIWCCQSWSFYLLHLPGVFGHPFIFICD